MLWLGLIVWVIGFFFEAVGDEHAEGASRPGPTPAGQADDRGPVGLDATQLLRRRRHAGSGAYTSFNLSGDLGRAWPDQPQPLLMACCGCCMYPVPLLEKKYKTARTGSCSASKYYTAAPGSNFPASGREHRLCLPGTNVRGRIKMP